VEAVDLDEGLNSRLVYLIPDGLADHMFIIDSTGMIKTNGLLDRENKSIYSFSGK